MPPAQSGRAVLAPELRRWRKHSAMIREVVDERRMPPWHADPRYGHFSNDRSLTAKERATLLAWVDQGTPLGDLKDLPAPRTFPQGWSIGQPDVVFELPETYYVPAQGVVSYVYFRVPTNFKEDRWIQAAEAVPGDPSVVHHIVVYLMDRSRGGPGRGRGPGEHFCGYAPGDLGTILPEGTAKKIPAGIRTDPPGPLYAQRPRADRPLQGRVHLRQDQADPAGLHHRDRQPRPDAPGRARRRRRVLRDRRAAGHEAGEFHASHAPPGQGLQVHHHQAG